MSKDINKQEFDASTTLKLDIFRDSFEEWLPVFIHDQYTQGILIMDFFAGSGTDAAGNPGSPLVLLDAAKGEDRRYCKKASEKDIRFFFNESMKGKNKKLEEAVKKHLSDCEQQEQCGGCCYQTFFEQKEFKDIFTSQEAQRIFENTKYAKFILLDQYGFKQVDDEVFKKLISYGKTDFIFFISSSTIKRFKEHEYTKAYIDTNKIKFDETLPSKCHRVIADYFKSLIPEGKEYFLHHFSLKKETGNVYGLIFGSQHSLGMEKFIKVCWKYDGNSGESNFNIEGDYTEGELFYTPETSNKKERIKQELREDIMAGNIKSNKVGLKRTLHKGCEPRLFTEVVKELVKEKKIEITAAKGKPSFASTNIHKVNEYKIEVLAK